MLELKGIVPALISPSDNEGNLDLSPIKLQIKFLLDRDVKGLFVGGSTGEGFLLTVHERKLLAEKVVEEVAGRVPVVIHVGGMDVRNVVELSKHAASINADAVSSVQPFYYAYDLGEVRNYYQTISEASGLPVIVYQLQQAGALMPEPEKFIEAILSIDNIYGVKFSCEDVYLMQCLKQISMERLSFFGGCDERPLPMFVMGASALIGSSYNFIPELWVNLYKAFENNDLEKALILQNRVTYYARKLWCCSKPVPRAKTLLRLRGIDVGQPRLPAAITLEEEKLLQDVLNEMRTDPLVQFKEWSL